MMAALLTLIGAAFVAIGVVILVRGDAADRGLGWGVIAFFGACTLVGVFEFMRRQRAIPSNAEQLTLQPSRGRLIGMAIGSLAMGIGCFALAPLAWADGERFAGAIAYLGAAFFGLGSLVIASRAITQQPLARLDEDGVHTFGPGAWSLSWREIHGISGHEIEFVQVLAFETTRQSLMPMQFWISPTFAGFAFEDVHAFAMKLWARHRGP